MDIKVKKKNKWIFKNEFGDFSWEDPAPPHELYMPLCNEKGMMSSITPYLHGDIKVGNDYFLTEPVSIEDLHNKKSARNFWIYITGKGAWSATGNSSLQNSRVHNNEYSTREVEAGLLWHHLLFTDKEVGLESSIINFVASEDNAEIMMVSIKNISDDEIELTPTSSIPIYARSAENIRDHRHVTSLVNRAILHDKGIFVKPVIKFDEKGHTYNNKIYYVLGCDENGFSPAGIIPLTKDFIGERGSFDWPEAIVKNTGPKDLKLTQLDGKEYVGALKFAKTNLNPGESITYILFLGICDSLEEGNNVLEKFNSKEKVISELEKVKLIWNTKAGNISFDCGTKEFSNWMRWVCIQPTLRKIYGNSFLPYHDYGKGGRGWRDLWQDVLTLILQDPMDVRSRLINNLSGVKIDGTNATIIRENDEGFISDRNKIPRVWMDHGAWPFLSIKLFIDQTGDFDILLEKTNYFQDDFCKRTREKIENLKPNDDYILKTTAGEDYNGTVIEHILIQHMVSFFNVGEHNIILLEHADWNDGIDMAMNRGESIPFTALYGSNLLAIAGILTEIKKRNNIDTIEIFEEMQILFDTQNKTHDYSSVEYKTNLLDDFFDKTSKSISGKKARISIEMAIDDLKRKAESIYETIRQNEWISIDKEHGFYKSYYDNEGKEVDICNDEQVQMQLIAQVFTIMGRVATENQVQSTYKTCYKHLKDPSHGGYRLNTETSTDILNFGRFLAFAYGEKENGATFSHMVVMYMNALYKRGFVKEGHEVFQSLYNLSIDVKNSKIYPGIPEYFNSERKGLYPYLTGSASWLVLTYLQEVLGIKGQSGDLVIEPKLMKDQFDENGNASVNCFFQNRKIKVIYKNKKLLNYGDYGITGFNLNSSTISKAKISSNSILIPRNIFIDNVHKNEINIIIVELGPKHE